LIAEPLCRETTLDPTDRAPAYVLLYSPSPPLPLRPSCSTFMDDVNRALTSFESSLALVRKSCAMLEGVVKVRAWTGGWVCFGVRVCVGV
jgi:hypothetical protein